LAVVVALVSLFVCPTHRHTHSMPLDFIPGQTIPKNPLENSGGMPLHLPQAARQQLPMLLLLLLVLLLLVLLLLLLLVLLLPP